MGSNIKPVLGQTGVEREWRGQREGERIKEDKRGVRGRGERNIRCAKGSRDHKARERCERCGLGF